MFGAFQSGTIFKSLANEKPLVSWAIWKNCIGKKYRSTNKYVTKRRNEIAIVLQISTQRNNTLIKNFRRWGGVKNFAEP